MYWYYRAKVIKVLKYDKVDFNVDLGFNVKFRLKANLQMIDVDSKHASKAKDCLVAVIGGSRVIIGTKKMGSDYIVSCFLQYYVPMENVSVVVNDKKLPSVYKIMQYAESIQFDCNEIHVRLQ